jgi:hypothetical protein
MFLALPDGFLCFDPTNVPSHLPVAQPVSLAKPMALEGERTSAMIGAYLPRREWLVPAVVVGLGLAAIAGNLAIAVGSTRCESCWQAIVVYAVGLPIALAALLAAGYGAAPMIMRRALLLAGLVFAVNFYLGFLQVRGLRLAGPVEVCDARAPFACVDGAVPTIRIVWNLGLSTVLCTVSLWGTFARPPRAVAAD